MKQQSLWIRLLVLALALVMTVSVFAACATEDEDGSDADASQNEVDGTEGDTEPEAETDKDGFIVDGLGDVKFDGAALKILVDKSYRKQVAPKEEECEGDPVRQVIYARNETVQERLGVEITFVESTAGAWGGAAKVLQDVETACETEPYDAICIYNLTPYMLAVNGLCANLYDEDSYLDLTAPWWPASLLDEILVNDTLYAITESNDYGLLRNMMAMFFNPEMLEARNLESPYDLVKNNEWTIDKLSEMIKDTYEDKNGDGKRDAEDIYGFVNATNAKRDAWFFALGNKYSEVQDGEIVSLVGGDHIQTYIDKMVNFYTDDTMLWDAPTYGGTAQDIQFRNERAYFYSSGVFMTEEIKRDESTFEYGVVPMPKMNSQQDRYYTHLSNTYDTWCVSFNAKDMDLSSAVLECMASEAYRKIGPTYFDTYVKLRYASNEQLGPMYDLVRDSVTFDLIYLYSVSYTVNPKDSVKSCITNPTANSWSSVYATNKDPWDTAFQSIVDTYAK